MGVSETRSIPGWGLFVALLTGAALFSSCNSLPVPSHSAASFRYELSSATDVLTVGEPLHFEWVPHADPNYETGTADVTLCFGLFGPWPDAAAVKREFAASQTAACPPPGAAVASESVRTTSSAGARLKADATAPALPGFYNLRQVNIFRAGSTGGSMTFDRVVQLRAR
jgi:hypothetical protein